MSTTFRHDYHVVGAECGERVAELSIDSAEPIGMDGNEHRASVESSAAFGRPCRAFYIGTEVTTTIGRRVWRHYVPRV